MKNRIKQVRHFFEKYERVMLPLMLLFGVTTDYIAFKTIDTVWAFVWLGFHLVEAFAVMVFIHWFDARAQRRFLLGGHTRAERALSYVRIVAPLLLQMSFGALLNASFVFYWFSASFSVSWPFFVIVVMLMVSNDVFRHYYLKPVVQVGVYAFASFSIMALMIPFWANSIDAQWFVIAGMTAMVIGLVFVWMLAIVAKSVRSQMWQLVSCVFVVFAIMNTLYFFHLIPPIPLSLREAEVVHSIVRKTDGYHLMVESENFWDEWNPVSTIHVKASDQVFIYSSIFAPTDLHTDIFHRWQFFDDSQHKWMDVSRYGFSITGGRQDGYRGYSFKARLQAGKWRVQVETPRGQVLARVRFNVVMVDQSPPLIEEIR